MHVGREGRPGRGGQAPPCPEPWSPPQAYAVWPGQGRLTESHLTWPVVAWSLCLTTGAERQTRRTSPLLAIE